MYSYYDYLRDYYTYEEPQYYEDIYWPQYYGVYNISNDSWCDYILHHNTTQEPYAATTDFNITLFNNTHFITTSDPTRYFTTDAFNCTPRHNGTFPPYIWERWWYKDIDIIGLSQVPFACIMAILSITIAAFFFIKLKGAMHAKNRPDRLTVFLSSLCMISMVLFNILDVFQFYFWFYDYDWMIYTYIGIAWEILWTISKVSLYSLFAYRYYMLQEASISNPQTKKEKFVLFGLIISGILAQIVLQTIYSIYNFDHLLTGFDDPNFEEKEQQYLRAAWMVSILDFVLVLGLAMLIMRTILRLVLAMNDPTGFHMKSTTSQKTERSAVSVVSSTGGMSSSADGSKDISSAMQKETNLKPKFPRIKSLSSWSQSQMSEERAKRSSKQFNLMQVTTRIALTCMVSILSSFVVQFMWTYIQQTENYKLQFLTWLWGIDGVMNMCCVYFTMAFAKAHYQKVCGDICKCHSCCLWCVMKVVSHEVSKKKKKEVELASKDARMKDAVDVTDVSPQVTPEPTSPL